MQTLSPDHIAQLYIVASPGIDVPENAGLSAHRFLPLISWAGPRISAGHPSLICPGRCLEMLIEPVEEGLRVLGEGEPAVAGALLDDELRVDPGLLQPLDDRLGLLERDEPIPVTVDDECRGVIGRDVVDRGDLAGDLLETGGVGDRDPEVALFVEL